MTLPGYHGVLLDVDLTAGTVGTREIPDEDLERFVGGRGLGVKLLWDLLGGPGVDPLSPDNPLLFMPGPFGGFPIPSASRTCVVTKSPATSPRQSAHPHASTVSYANVGGYLGPEIRFAGYDGVLIRGASPHPVMLVIDGQRAELRDALHLWRRGTDDTDRMLLEELGSGFETCFIGPAGENQVSYACIMHTPARSAGRGGVGAVMGSKKLKALAVRGGGQPGVADHAGFWDQIARMRGRFSGLGGSALVKFWRSYGTALGIEVNSASGVMSLRNFGHSSFAEAKAIGAKAARQGVWARDHACFCCPLSCKKSGVVRDGPHAGIVHDGPEYETGVMFGANLLIGDLPAVLHAIRVADDLGLDIISAGNVIGFLMEAREKGDIDANFLDGVDLAWGDADATLAWIGRIARREGRGDLAARGVRALSREIGDHTAPYAIHVKGLELAAHNVYGNPGMGLCYATASRGGCHLAGRDVGRQDFTTVVDALGLCLFATNFGLSGMPGLKDKDLAAMMGALTGQEWHKRRLLEAGARIYTLERAFNVREGFGRADDTLPDRFFEEPMPEGPKKGVVVDRDEFAAELDGYYAERGWDPETGVPTPERLEELDLSFVGSLT